MSSTTTTTTTITPDLSSLGHHLASHIHSQLRISLRLASDITTNKALFTRAEFKAAVKDLDHPLRDQCKLVVYDYQALYESLGKQLMTPWNLRSSELSCFRVLSDWVRELKGPEKRDLRNDVAHSFNTGSYFRDLDGFLESADEADSCARRGFSAGKMWDLLEVELEPVRKELVFAVGVFEEEIRRMPVQTRKPREERVVEDMSTPEIPAGWSEEGSWGEEVVVGEEVGGWEWGVAEEIDEVESVVLALEKLSISEEDEGYGSE